MTPEQIENLCKQAGFTPHTWPHGFSGQIANLIKLVRNAALEEAAVKCEQDYRVQEARRAHADSMTLGGANHAYFNEVMARLTVTADTIRNLKEPTP